MRFQQPWLMCDAPDGCGDDAPDYYEQLASSVSGVKVTSRTRAPGWWSDDDSDYCPEHAPAARKQDAR